jgi:hypothetical protein
MASATGDFFEGSVVVRGLWLPAWGRVENGQKGSATCPEKSKQTLLVTERRWLYDNIFYTYIIYV